MDGQCFQDVAATLDAPCIIRILSQEIRGYFILPSSNLAHIGGIHTLRTADGIGNGTDIRERTGYTTGGTAKTTGGQHIGRCYSCLSGTTTKARTVVPRKPFLS